MVSPSLTTAVAARAAPKNGTSDKTRTMVEACQRREGESSRRMRHSPERCGQERRSYHSCIVTKIDVLHACAAWMSPVSVALLSHRTDPIVEYVAALLAT